MTAARSARTMWHRIWHKSIKNRLTFLFFCITAGAILVFYFYVVPQLESTLTQQKTDALERDASAYSRSLAGRDRARGDRRRARPRSRAPSARRPAPG